MDNIRLLLLKMKIVEFHFQIVHIPGRLHTGPDAMSRYPAASKYDSIEESYCSGISTNYAENGEVLTVDIRRKIFAGLATIEAEDIEQACSGT